MIIILERNVIKPKAIPHVCNKIEVYWPHDAQYYPGTVKSISEEDNIHEILYEDGDN